MRPSAILALHREAIREMTGRYRTANLRIFGSVLHGTDTEKSDIDLLVDALPGATMIASAACKTTCKRSWASELTC